MMMESGEWVVLEAVDVKMEMKSVIKWMEAVKLDASLDTKV